MLTLKGYTRNGKKQKKFQQKSEDRTGDICPSGPRANFIELVRILRSLPSHALLILATLTKSKSHDHNKSGIKLEIILTLQVIWLSVKIHVV